MANLSSPGSVFKSLLFAPGNKKTVLSKLPRSEPSASIIDLEDSVPLDEKENQESRKYAELVARREGSAREQSSLCESTAAVPAWGPVSTRTSTA